MIKRMNVIIRGWSWLATLVTVSAVFFFLAFLANQGLPVLDKKLFFGDVSPWQAISGSKPVWDALWPAIAGTMLLVLGSALIAIPVGVASGIYLAQYAKGPLRNILSFCVELLAGIPSIIMGLFGFAMILMLRRTFAPQANTCLLLAAVCIALLVLPYLVFTTRTALEGIPESVKLIGPALGFTPWQNITHILLPAASRSILGGIVLSLGRAAEDTAVIMLTGVVANAGLPHSLTGKFEALPFKIFYLAAEYRNPEELNLAYGAAFVLLCLTGLLFMTAYLLQKTLEWRWNQN